MTHRQVAEPGATAATTQAVRDLISALRVADAPAADLATATDLVEQATALLTPHRVEGVRSQAALRMDPTAGSPMGTEPAAFFPYSPVVGPLSALAPPATLHFDGERMHGTVTVTEPYSGPPAMAHGGVIALIFDELLGCLNVCRGMGAFTGTLKVRYERPTPLLATLDLEAWIDRIEGRKVLVSGEIRHDGTVTARAEGIFVQAPLLMPTDPATA